MLEYLTLEHKPQIKYNDKEEGEIYIDDLLARTWPIDKEFEYVHPVVIEKYYECRPDLVSLALYGTDKYADLICKYNGISPFELAEGMIICCPDPEYVHEGIRNREFESCELISDSETTSISTKKNKKLRTETHSPSEIVAGTPPPYIIDRTMGVVFY